MKKTILSLTLLLAMPFMAAKVNAQFSVGISVNIAPPVIPVYVQPACPVDGWLWVPGYWGWDEDDEEYYWVPGYWAEPPMVGYLWTPGYWGFGGGAYYWHAGYWGPHVGYYGGINYGCGYGGYGYVGGEWYGSHFRYNTAVTRVNTTIIHNTYVNRTVINNVTVNNRVSYNGGPGGVRARPTMGEQAVMREHHIGHTNVQVRQQQAAMYDRGNFANVNHGRPATPAMARPMGFNGNHVFSTMSRPQAQAQQWHPQPQQFRPQPQPQQFHAMNQPRPQMPQNNAPRPMAQGGGGAPHGFQH